MTMELTPSDSAIACAEKIALLHLLHQVPCPPRFNPVQQPLIDSNTSYSLPFNRERDLCATLAFLSGVREGPDGIPALCLHESPQGNLDILIAVNAARYGQGHHRLDSIKTGFDVIFRLLSASSTEDDVFAAIVSMCHSRICSRMRFIGRKRKKKNIAELLRAVQEALPSSSQLQQRAREVVSRVDSWSQRQTAFGLQRLVRSVHQLTQLDLLDDVIRSIPDRQMTRECRDCLLNMLKKVSRYLDAAEYLCKTAKKYPMVRRMQTQLVTLPGTTPKGAAELQTHANLESKLQRMGLLDAQQSTIHRVWPFFAPSETKTLDMVVQQRNETILKGKVHAEIQLLFHCERVCTQPLPRVICSSKDACYLCNTFISMHGKFYTPRSHGRLYPSWRLPTFPESDGLSQRFLTLLDRLIQESVCTTLSRRRRTHNPCPNESTVPSIEMSRTTLASPTEDDSIESIKDIPLQRPALRSIGEVAERGPETGLILPRPPALPVGPTPLSRGEITVDVVQAGGSSALYEAWPLRVQIEYSIHLRAGYTTTRTLVCCLEWLIDEDVEAVRDANDASVVDAELMDGQVNLRPEDLSNLYISARGTLLRLRIE